jgi:hypothetical protein
VIFFVLTGRKCTDHDQSRDRVLLWQWDFHQSPAKTRDTTQVMAQSIQIVAQYAMDTFYQNYRVPTDFFTLDDFVFHCQAAVGEIFMQGFAAEYGRLRQEKQDEVVSFSHDWLSEQVLPVKHTSMGYEAHLDKHPFSFPFDQQDSGIQEVLAVDPYGAELERTSVTAIWQFKLAPPSNRIFWYVDRGHLRFLSNGTCPLKKIRLLYVPSMCEDMDVPDGVISMTVNSTVSTMKQLVAGVVQKKSIDQNNNKTLETEIDRSQFKG